LRLLQLKHFATGPVGPGPVCTQENPGVTKKEIVKQISERIGLTQLKTKEIVQQTFDAIVDTLIEVGRIELRNFGVFEVKLRKARKARNPRTGERVDVEPKMVVTFKPGKEMEEKVRAKGRLPSAEAEAHPVVLGNDDEDGHAEAVGSAKNTTRPPKM
jgi:nucleoid DNA-binding protein